ncbi:MAG: hypothetical protein HY460_01050, partial [Parcubacteria group bacterium]|nr:hypothetical protein [Parcubacteria group bacterium]
AYINSWDFLTTDGPVFQDIDEFVVWYEQGRHELEKYDHVSKPIHNVGPIHLDTTFVPGHLRSKEEICRYFRMDPRKRIIVFGSYNRRLGTHEPSIITRVAAEMIARHNAYLVVRGHPYDESFFDRYGEIGKMPGVILCKGRRFSEEREGDLDDQTILYSLLRHCDVLICSATTLTLDGIRFDKPVINIGFDGDLQIPKEASVERKYTYDHYAPLMSFDGISFVRSYDELASAIEQGIESPQEKAEGRKSIRRLYLEPLDGHASDRFISLLTTA